MRISHLLPLPTTHEHPHLAYPLALTENEQSKHHEQNTSGTAALTRCFTEVAPVLRSGLVLGGEQPNDVQARWRKNNAEGKRQ